MLRRCRLPAADRTSGLAGRSGRSSHQHQGDHRAPEVDRASGAFFDGLGVAIHLYAGNTALTRRLARLHL